MSLSTNSSRCLAGPGARFRIRTFFSGLCLNGPEEERFRAARSSSFPESEPLACFGNLERPVASHTYFVFLYFSHALLRERADALLSWAPRCTPGGISLSAEFSPGGARGPIPARGTLSTGRCCASTASTNLAIT